MTCVCGHVAKHHNKRRSVYAGLMADYRVVFGCGWTGCGCPEFVKVAANAATLSPDSGPDAPASASSDSSPALQKPPYREREETP